MAEEASLASILTFSQAHTLCQITPLVPATILHYHIRSTGTHTAGMLLGVREGNIVSIRNCYPVLLRYSEEKDVSEQEQRVHILQEK